jgi:hypothetical protein
MERLGKNEEGRENVGLEDWGTGMEESGAKKKEVEEMEMKLWEIRLRRKSDFLL